MSTKLSFAKRAEAAEAKNENPLKSYLLHLISEKKTNLCLSADVNSTASLLRLAEEVGDYICVLKTHADIVDDFGYRTIKNLREISRRKKFLLFEDRKFGDIGSTVQQQYARGPLAIASWAHIVNAHVFPGPAIVTSLKEAAAAAVRSLGSSVETEIYVGTPIMSEEGDSDEDSGVPADSRPRSKSKTDSKRSSSVITTTSIHQTFEHHNMRRVPPSPGSPPILDPEVEVAMAHFPEPPLARGLLLFAQMSSKGNLMNESYTRACVETAKEHSDFVIGFIAQQSLNESSEDNFISMTPGVKLAKEGGGAVLGDGLGQQYRSPNLVVREHGCDIIIVGRGIIEAKNRKKEAEKYRREAWKAYEARLKG